MSRLRISRAEKRDLMDVASDTHSAFPLFSSQVLPILEILYHVEDRNSHHVYMALIILLILTEDDTFNRSIHEVVGRHNRLYACRPRVAPCSSCLGAPRCHRC